MISYIKLDRERVGVCLVPLVLQGYYIDDICDCCVRVRSTLGASIQLESICASLRVLLAIEDDVTLHRDNIIDVKLGGNGDLDAAPLIIWKRYLNG